MTLPRTNQRGFVSAIFLIVATLIILGYFNINIETILASEQVQENLKYAWELSLTGIKHLFGQIQENLPPLNTN